MGFEDLEKQLRVLFQKTVSPVKQDVKQRVRIKALEAFVQKESTHTQFSFWKKIFTPKTSSLAFLVSALFVLFNLFPGDQSLLSAGKLVPKFGPDYQGTIEILRGNKTILVEEAMSLKKGDIIRVGNKAEVEIVFPDKLLSTAEQHTQLKVVDDGSLFLQKGNLKTTSFLAGEISTSRGFVQGSNGSGFEVRVSDSGETKIISLKNSIDVFDWDDGGMTLQEGEEVNLRSDTQISSENIPTDLSLSVAQIQAIRAKLIIARTKNLTGIEKILVGAEPDAKRDIASAKDSFRSITQILESSRSLEITKRKSLERVQLDDVIKALTQKGSDQQILSEALAVKALLELTDSNINLIKGFGFVNTKLPNFNRFVLLDRIFSLAGEEEQPFAEILKQKYVISFLRKVQNEELRIDQISMLNREIEKLPKTDLAVDFLERVKELFAPDLAEILEEKIKDSF